MDSQTDRLTPELVEKILGKLGYSEPPSVDIRGLTSLYSAWCHSIPFDNIRKRVHLAADNPLPLPGHDNAEFYQGWLRFGVGGLCWAGNAALCALLDSLGFLCNHTTATMLTDSKQPINHGTVVVQLEDKHFLVDASMLHNAPLLLDPHKPSTIEHPAWGLSCSLHDKQWVIRWRPLHMLEGCLCRVEELFVPRDTFRQFNEVTRTQSPFNDALYIRLNIQESVMGISGRMAISFNHLGVSSETHLSHEGRVKLLVEKLGISEEIISQLPPDRNF